MLVFVCETVTGGGFSAEPLPESLIAEGALMRDALIGDLEDLPGVRVVTTHDARLTPPLRGESEAIEVGMDPRPVWARLAAQARCSWPIAPETGGELEALVELLSANGQRVISPDMETLRICVSKSRTASILANAGISVVATWPASHAPEGQTGPFVIKPDDGAGSLDTFIVETVPRDGVAEDAVVQPLLAGEAASLSLLCQSGRAHVLAANRQHVERVGNRFAFRGVTVGGLSIEPELRTLADAVMAALPGLHGIVGIDYIATDHGPVVLEINPRLTTSYAGLHRSLGVNPTAFVAELIRDGAVPDVPHMPSPLPVEVML